MLYQEDIMKVASAVADFSMATGDELRKQLTKKHSMGRIAALRKHFLQGAAAHSADAQTAARIWELISNFAAYAYNKAHACTYGHISYQATYLKTHWPVEFFCAVLNNIGGFYSQREYVEDARRAGVRFLAPHVNHSDVWFTCERLHPPPPLPQRAPGEKNRDSHLFCGPGAARDSRPGGKTGDCPYFSDRDDQGFAIRVGLIQVRGLKRRTMKRTIAERANGPYGSLADFCARVRPSIDEARNLVLCGALDFAGKSRPQLLWQIDAAFGRLSRGGSGEAEKAGLFDAVSDDAPPTGESPPLGRYPVAQRMALEQYVLNLTPTDHPLAAFESLLKRRSLVKADRLHKHVGGRVTVAGLLIATRRARTRNNEFMKFLTLEDRTGVIEVTLFPKVYQAMGDRLIGYGPFLVRGKVESNHGAVTLNADYLEKLQAAGPKRRSA
jgi:DNA polymerase III alpha subunit